jgi:hypothetical protein
VEQGYNPVNAIPHGIVENMEKLPYQDKWKTKWSFVDFGRGESTTCVVQKPCDKGSEPG